MRSSTSGSFHVAINAQLLSGQAGYRSAGVHQYIGHLLRYITQSDPGLRFTVLTNKTAHLPNPDLMVYRTSWPTHRVPVRVLWEQAVQPRVLRRIGADLVHCPVFVGPVLSPCPSVITIHDLSFLRYPRFFHPTNRLYLSLMTKVSARRARRVIAVSRFTASESVALLGLAPERVEVVYHGVEPVFRPLPRAMVEHFRHRQGLPEQFVLFVGTLEPRKNLVRLVEAIAQLGRDAVPLVLVGGAGWLYRELYSRIKALELERLVRWVGYVDRAELPLWYNSATVFAYPSLYEGFGLPVLEAQACGVPVVTSDCSSLPEAGGDAALLINPWDVQALADSIARLLRDVPLREELREKGLARAQSFNWPRTAHQTTHVYRQALTGARDEMRRGA